MGIAVRWVRWGCQRWLDEVKAPAKNERGRGVDLDRDVGRGRGQRLPMIGSTVKWIRAVYSTVYGLHGGGDIYSSISLLRCGTTHKYAEPSHER